MMEAATKFDSGQNAEHAMSALRSAMQDAVMHSTHQGAYHFPLTVLGQPLEAIATLTSGVRSDGALVYHASMTVHHQHCLFSLHTFQRKTDGRQPPTHANWYAEEGDSFAAGCTPSYHSSRWMEAAEAYCRSCLREVK
jgi:hypothetical protein